MNRDFSACGMCDYYKQKPKDSKFGTWEGTCTKMKIGRNWYSESCSGIEVSLDEQEAN